MERGGVEGIDGGMALEMVRDDWLAMGLTGLQSAKVVSRLKKLK
jgi:hypothetical protein